MIGKLLTAGLLCCGIFAHGALELYCDFEKKESNKTTDVGGISGSFKVDPGPRYIDEAPPALAGRSRRALDLDKGFVFFRDSPELAENWTINCFVKPQPDGAGARTLIYRPGGWMLQFNAQRRSVELVQSGAPDNVVAFKPIGGGDVWQMWTLVKSGKKVQFYLDGKLLGEQLLKAALPATGQLYVGAASSNGGRPALAAIDDLAIWSHALTAADVAALFAGKPPLEIAAANVLSRQPTVPFTEAKTKIHRPKSELDVTKAVIVPNDDAGGMALAEKVRQLLKSKWGVELPIRRVANHADGRENLILCGRGMANILSRELAANQQIVRDTLGSELRILPEALDWKRGVVYLAGRDDAEVLAAAEALLKRYPRPDQLKFTIDVLHPVETTDPDAPVAKAKAHFASHEARKVNLALNTYLLEAFENYRATGDDRHVRAFSEILGNLFQIYVREMAADTCAPTFEFYLFPQYLYLIENSPAFADADRVKSAEYMRAVMEKAMDSWELVNPAKSYAMGKQDYYTNHYCFASRTVAVSARYLLSRHDYEPAKYFLAVGENTFAGVKNCPLSPEDAGGYQYLVYRIFMDYMLSAGKFDGALLASPEFKEYLEYAKSTLNHLGYTPGYGDAYSTGMRGPFFLLREAVEVTGDEESARLLSLIARTAGGDDNFYLEKCRAWGVKPDLPLISDPRFNGLRVLTVNPVRQKILGLIETARPKLDKAIFRSSWQPDAEFLAVNGLNGSPHGHDDAIGISQYLVGPHLWLLEGDYIRRAVEDHNLVSIIRNGVGLSRQRNRIPDLERFAQVAGQTQNAEKNMALLSLVIEKCNGVDYFRHIGWEAGGGLWVIDELRAVEPGDYRFVSGWRTTGELAGHAQGVTVKQKSAPTDGGLSAFSIAEGTGAAAFGYSNFERTHGRANRSLSYNYSDGVIRTRLYWKDAALTAGQKSFFVQYFRAVPGKNPAAVPVEEIAPGVYAAGTGAGRSTIAVGDGVVFTSPRGTLALPAGAKAPVAANMAAGTIRPNLPMTPPAGVTAGKGALLAEYGKQISAVAAGSELLAIGLEDGEFLLLDRAGQVRAKAKFPTEVSAIAVIPTPEGERFAVGCRPVNVKEISEGTLRLLDASGRELWKKDILAFKRRPGTPTTIFPARLAGKDQPPAIVAGVEGQHYYAFDLDGKQILAKEVTHGATVGVAGDFDGDGRDEIYGGVEYYWREIFDATGKRLSRSTTSPWDNAAVFGAVPADGPKRVFAARRDGFLYTESPDAANVKPWSVRLGGPAYGLVLLPNQLAAATINGYITLVNGEGKVSGSVKLPAPLTALAAHGKLLYAPGLDGRVYAVDPAAAKAVAVVDCAQPTGMERFLPKLAVSGDALFAVFGNQVFRIDQ
jgi:hypothetical protein